MKKLYYLFVFLLVFNTCGLYAEDIFPVSDIIEIPSGPFESGVPAKFAPDPEDLDNDGLKNAEEERYGTNPNDPDTDNDSMPDLWEVTSGTNPLINDRNVDLDSDLYSNLMEYVFHSDPPDQNDMPANASRGSYYEYDELGRIKSIIRAK